MGSKIFKDIKLTGGVAALRARPVCNINKSLYILVGLNASRFTDIQTVCLLSVPNSFFPFTFTREHSSSEKLNERG